MIEDLEKMAGLNIPKDLSSEEANQYLRDACLKHEIKCPPPETTARLLDKVISFLPLLSIIFFNFLLPFKSWYMVVLSFALMEWSNFFMALFINCIFYLILIVECQPVGYDLKMIRLWMLDKKSCLCYTWENEIDMK